MSKSKNNKNRGDNELLSFEELKDKVNNETSPDEKTDSEFDDLLSSLGGSNKIESEKKESGFEIDESALSDNSDDDKRAEAPAKENNESSDGSIHTEHIYNDILSAINDTAEAPEATARRTKYASEGTHFVDVTNQYQKSRDDEKPQPFEEAIIRPDKTKEPTASEKSSDEGSTSSESAEIKEEKPVRTFNEIFKGWCKGFFPNKHDRASEIVRKVIMDISVFTLIGCGIWFGILMGQKNSANKQNDAIKGQIINSDDNISDEEAWAEFFAKYPNVTLPEGMMPKYAYLYAINNNLVGWIRVPNSIIDVQVVQAADNDEYLKKDFYGNYSRYGCPFLDYRNDPKYLSQNTIIYGHHMSDGLVFAELDKFKTIEGFSESPIIEYDTLYKTYKFKVYAAFITNSTASQDNGYLFNYITPKFASKEDFDGYVAALDERKLYTTGVSLDYTDKLITLSTCSYEFSDARLVVVGRLLRDGESESVDTTLAVTNENPHYPQIWYDKKGQANPFASAEKWYPAS